MLNRRACLTVLLFHGASMQTRSALGWTPMNEACGLGDRDVLREVLAARREQTASFFKERTALLIAQLRDLDDFYLEMNWDFSSWIPLVSRLCPNDKYKIWKRGPLVRVDTTLVGFEHLKWVRGSISFMFIVNEDESDGSL